MLIPIGFLGGGGAAGSYELISSTILTGTATSVTFNTTGLGSTYKHLQLRMTARSDKASTQSHYMYLNGDTGSNYAFHTLEGNGSSVLSSATTSYNRLYTFLGGLPGTNSTTGSFEAGVVDFLDAFSTSKNKTLRTLHGTSGLATNVRLNSGLWLNTAAITSIQIQPETNNYIAGSRFSLYGIKG